MPAEPIPPAAIDHRALLERHRAVMPSWLALYYEQPIALVDGKGCRVRDAEGNEYLDFFGGILTTMTGHNVPEVVDAIREQAGHMLHTSTLYLNDAMVRLAEHIAALSRIPDAKVFFGSSGSEATDTALLLATSFRCSSHVLALRNSYHGRSVAAMGVTDVTGWSASSLSPFEVSYVPNGSRYRGALAHLSDAAFIDACADELRSVIEGRDARDAACLIAEPIQGVGGFTLPPDGFFRAMKSVLDEYGILLVSDEVQTGWGRTGEHFWGMDAHGVVPDMMTFAKGLGNGLAIGGVVARGEVMDCLDANSISTFGGNPLAAAGALANLRYVLDNDLQENARRVGSSIITKLRAHATTAPIVGDVRGKGLMIGIELVKPGGTEPDPAAAAAVLERTRARGLLVGKGGPHGSVLRITPPLSISQAEADEGIDILLRALDEVATA